MHNLCICAHAARWYKCHPAPSSSAFHPFFLAQCVADGCSFLGRPHPTPAVGSLRSNSCSIRARHLANSPRLPIAMVPTKNNSTPQFRRLAITTLVLLFFSFALMCAPRLYPPPPNSRFGPICTELTADLDVTAQQHHERTPNRVYGKRAQNALDPASPSHLGFVALDVLAHVLSHLLHARHPSQADPFPQ